jgi:putative ABC transport system permease protein
MCAVVLAVLTAVLCGAGPVLWLTGRNSGVKQWLTSRRMASGTRAERRTIGSLVAVQSAISVTLLLGAGLLIHTMVKLAEVDPGFRPDGVVAVRLLPPQSKRTTQFPAFAMEAITKMEAMPTVSAVGGISHFPVITSGWWMDDIMAEDLPEPLPGSELQVELRLVTPNYFRAIGVPQLGGRSFTWHDDANTQHVVILSKSLAHQLWPGSDPLGKRVRSTVDKDKLWATVVGIVGDVQDFGLDTRPRLLMYRPIGQGGWPNTTLFVRSTGDLTELQRRIRAELPAVAAGTRIRSLHTVSEALQKSLAPRRFSMVLLASFAAFAWLLSFVGTYGMVAYSVTSRTREIGIRMALGARSGQILRGVIRTAVVPVACGIVIGVPTAVALAHSVRSFLFGVQTTDITALAGSSTLLLVSAALAAFIPGRRAAGIDPGVTLRTE